MSAAREFLDKPRCEHCDKSQLYKDKIYIYVNKMHVDILGEQTAVKQIVALNAMITTNLKPEAYNFFNCKAKRPIPGWKI